jgi:lipopolysaccharide export system protein LptA
MSRATTPLAILAVLLSTVVAAEAMAASVRVTCEKRSNRAKISVDGRGLAPGDYTTEAISGGNVAVAGPVTAVRGQAETDYDSNPADIAEGATPISPAFIEGGRVTGKVVDASGFTVAEGTAVCRVRR